jgi:hypothetical protein
MSPLRMDVVRTTSSFTLVVRDWHGTMIMVGYNMPIEGNATVPWLLMFCGIVLCTQAFYYYAVSTSSTIREALSFQKKKVVTTATGRKVSILAPTDTSSTATTHPQLAPWLGIAPRFFLGLLFLVAQYFWIGNKDVVDESAPQIRGGMYNILSTLATIVGTLYYLRTTASAPIAAAAAAVASNTATTDPASDSSPTKELDQHVSDEEYFTKHLIDHPNPSSITHMDILFCVSTCPELLRTTQEFLAAAEEQKNRKQQILQERDSTNVTSTASTAANATKSAFELDDFGWADDNDGDQENMERAKKLRLFEVEKELEKQRMANLIVKKSQETEESSSLLTEEQLLSTKFEDLDEGVLGQRWVEQTLQSIDRDIWPPSNKNGTFSVDSVMDQPASRRNVCMLLARLHSQALNTHPALVEAGPKGLVDHTYFSHSAQFRPRFTVIIESVLLRLALVQNLHPLGKTIIEALSMFKIGIKSAVEKKSINWFNGVLLQTYGGLEGLPRLKITDPTILPESEEAAGTNKKDKVITAKDPVVLTLTIERTHAQKFLEHKLIMCKAQNLDPGMVLASYHEVWWILVSTQNKNDQDKTVPLMAFPFIVKNIAQKVGKVKCQFIAPGKPGQYKFLFDVKSTEFLGADQAFELEYDIVKGSNNDEEDEEETDGEDEEETDGEDEEETDGEDEEEEDENEENEN